MAYWVYNQTTDAMSNLVVDIEMVETAIDNNAQPNMAMFNSMLTPKIILLSILAVLLVMNNGLLILTILRHKHLRTKANYFVVALACSDFSLGFPSIPLHCMGEAGVFGTTQYACLVVMCFSCAQIVLSVLMLFSLSVERYVKLVHPFSYAKHITHRRVLLCITMCSIYSFIIGFLPLMGWNNAADVKVNGTVILQPCKFELVLSGSYIALVFLGHIGPTFIILPLLHLHIFVTAHKVLSRKHSNMYPQQCTDGSLIKVNSRSVLDLFKMGSLRKNANKTSVNCNSSIGPSSPISPQSPCTPLKQTHHSLHTFPNAASSHSRNYRHFKILVLMGTYFIVSWIPLVIWESVLWEGFTKDKITVYDLIYQSNTPMTMYYVALGLAVFNSAFNPILFGMGNLTTRRAFFNMCFSSCNCCKKNNMDNDMSLNSQVLRDMIAVK